MFVRCPNVLVVICAVDDACNLRIMISCEQHRDDLSMHMNPSHIVIDVVKDEVVRVEIAEFSSQDVAGAHPHLRIKFNGA